MPDFPGRRLYRAFYQFYPHLLYNLEKIIVPLHLEKTSHTPPAIVFNRKKD